MFLEASAATAFGRHRVVALSVLDGPLHVVVAKVGEVPWPNTRSAVLSVSGLVYSSTRLSPKSATYRSPVESIATPFGVHRVVALAVPAQLWVEVPVKPNTSAAGPPTHGKVFAHAVNGALNSSTRLLLLSET